MKQALFGAGDSPLGVGNVMEVTMPDLNNGLIFVLIAIAALGGAALWLRARRASVAASPAEALDTLFGWEPEATRVLTPSEHRAYTILQQALPGHMILAQVSVARFIRVPTRNSYAEWLRRVGHLCADLVICDPRSQVIAVVEVRSLRERSRERDVERSDRRQQRFARVLKAAGVPLHFWVENAMPSADEARRLILPDSPAIEPIPSGTPASAIAAAGAVPVAFAGDSSEPTTMPGVPLDLLPRAEEPNPQVDEVIEVREPPSSTWFDDFDSGHVPLTPAKRRRPPGPPSRR